MSGFSCCIKSAHFSSKSFSVSTDSIITPVTGSHVPRTKQWFKYGSFSPYFKKVEPMNVTLSPSSGGNMQIIAVSMNVTFCSRS